MVGGRSLKSVVRFFFAETVGESVAFWTIAIATFLLFSVLATTPGVGYSERFEAGDVVVFDYNGFLWPLASGNPSSNPVPYLAWWVFLGLVLAKVVMIVARLVLGAGTRRRRPRGAAANAKR